MYAKTDGSGYQSWFSIAHSGRSYFRIVWIAALFMTYKWLHLWEQIAPLWLQGRHCFFKVCLMLFFFFLWGLAFPERLWQWRFAWLSYVSAMRVRCFAFNSIAFWRSVFFLRHFFFGRVGDPAFAEEILFRNNACFNRLISDLAGNAAAWRNPKCFMGCQVCFNDILQDARHLPA